MMRLWLSLTSLCLALSGLDAVAKTTARTVPREWILKVRPGTVRHNFLIALPNLRFIRFFGPGNRFALVRGDLTHSDSLPKEVLYSQPNYGYQATEENSDPDVDKCWGLDNQGQTTPNGSAGLAGKDISAKAAWKLQDGSPSIVVAVVDSGILTTHEDLSSNLWTNPGEIPNNNIDDDGNGFIDDVHGWNFVAGSNNVEDDHDHGTMCAGIIGAASDNGRGSRGVTGQVRLMAVKSLDQNGFGTTANAISAIQYAVNNGATIINASWGGSSYDQALYDTINWAASKDVLFVAASGNDGFNNDTNPMATYPATFALPNVISVAAYDNRDQLASFSNFGKTTVDLGAPGVQIYSTSTGGYRYGDGTSFSAPYVTGVAALLRANAGDLNVIQLKDRILMTSDVISYYQKEKTKSAGRLNAYQALANIRPERPQLPTDWQKVAFLQSTAHPYTNSTNETYTFTSPGATHIRIHFTKFETEACCDLVVAKDSTGRLVDTYAGELGDFTSADALGDTISLTFSSDATMTKYGFDIDYYEVSQTRDLWWETRRDFLPPIAGLW